MLPADEAELLRIAAASARGGHRFTALLDAVLDSPLFLLRDPDAVGAPLPPTEHR
jgi:hypothetical protein